MLIRFSEKFAYASGNPTVPLFYAETKGDPEDG
jgi:hypothetical protein